MKKVVVLGGGVAGMSAAHELMERGFQVEVFEKKTIPGGKARSIPVPDSGTDGRQNLPGEHGFRFFPRFYKHVTDTMKRIPYKTNKNGVYDNLVGTSRMLLARFGEPSVLVLDRFPRNIEDIIVMLNEIFTSDLGITEEGKKFFAERIWQLMTSCKDRRFEEYERIGWWEYLQADRFNEAYRTLLVEGLTRTLVAAKAKEASTKTGGDIFLQLIFDMLSPGDATDRVLNGPTNDVWIYPWLDYLRSKGVVYHEQALVKSIVCDENSQEITSVSVEINGETQTVTADYYLSCVPVEVMSTLINPQMLAVDSIFKYIQELAPDVAWMNGVQLYLNQDVKIAHGHAIYVDSPWALTSISQVQFWKDFDISKHGNGKVKGILSIDVSDWESPGILEYGPNKIKKSAQECTREEIIQEIWAQLKRSLNVGGKVILTDDMLVTWFIDPDIQDKRALSFTSLYQNAEPLLVNKVQTWELRPNAFTGISNLFLAADYVRTNTDLATMEGANEAARRAVNCILDASDSDAKPCQIWDLFEPKLLTIMRWADKERYDNGLPWDGKLPFEHKALIEAELLEMSIKAKLHIGDIANR